MEEEIIYKEINNRTRYNINQNKLGPVFPATVRCHSLSVGIHPGDVNPCLLATPGSCLIYYIHRGGGYRTFVNEFCRSAREVRSALGRSFLCLCGFAALASKMDTILGTKSHMMQTFTQGGTRVPVTVVKTGPSVVIQVKKTEKDGYGALQIGFGAKKVKGITKPLLGHLKKAIEAQSAEREAQRGMAPRFLREVRTAEEEYKAGDVIVPSQVLKPGDLVQVTGVSKGKGFVGVVGRWGFAGGPKTHGQSDRLRAPGSIGRGTTPGRVVKGQKMAGRMGQEKATVKNLRVMKLDEEKGELWLSGLVPGARGSLLVIRKLGEAKKFDPLFVKETAEEAASDGSKEDK